MSKPAFGNFNDLMSGDDKPLPASEVLQLGKNHVMAMAKHLSQARNLGAEWMKEQSERLNYTQLRDLAYDYACDLIDGEGFWGDIEPTEYECELYISTFVYSALEVMHFV